MKNLNLHTTGLVLAIVIALAMLVPTGNSEQDDTLWLSVVDTSKQEVDEIDIPRIGNSTADTASMTLQDDNMIEDASSNVSNVAIDSKNFPDKAFREYVKQFDLDHNGRLSIGECMDVSEISVNNKGITSLKGIEHFEELQWLYAKNNKIQSLNLDSNFVLEVLHLQNNPIKKLDISECIALTDITRVQPRVHSKMAAWGDEVVIPSNTTLTAYGETLYRPGKPKSVSFIVKRLSMKPGEKQALEVYFIPQGVVSKCSWTSSNKKVATVDKQGGITAKARGNVTITVKTANGKKATCKVTVN